MKQTQEFHFVTFDEVIYIMKQDLDKRKQSILEMLQYVKDQIKASALEGSQGLSIMLPYKVYNENGLFPINIETILREQFKKGGFPEESYAINIINKNSIIEDEEFIVTPKYGKYKGDLQLVVKLSYIYDILVKKCLKDVEVEE